MKAIKCEMCDGRDLVKEDGVYICQNCGTKYSVEEAKKLVVEINGPIQIDKTADLNNLITLAKRAHINGDYVKAQEYYEQILLIDPENWEADFYSVVFAAKNSYAPWENFLLIMKKTVTVLERVKSDVPASKHGQELAEILKELSALAININIIANSKCEDAERNLIRRPELIEDNFRGLIELKQDALAIREDAIDILETYGNYVLSIFGDSMKSYAFSAYKTCIDIYSNTHEYLAKASTERRDNIIRFLSENDQASGLKYTKVMMLEEIQRMIDYFGKHQNLYDQYDQLKARQAELETFNLNGSNHKNGGLFLAIGIVLLYLAFQFGLLPTFGFFWSEKTGLAILFAVLTIAATVGGIVLIKKGNLYKSENDDFKKKKDSVIREKGEVTQSLNKVKKQISDIYVKYGKCELSQSETNPKTLKTIKGLIETGTSESIKDAVAFYRKSRLKK